MLSKRVGVVFCLQRGGGVIMRKYTLRELRAMETVSQGHTDDLKIKTEDTKVWLSRMTVEDGMPYNNMVTVEKLIDGRWVKTEEYPAR
jgi:hypothetical protein